MNNKTRNNYIVILTIAVAIAIIFSFFSSKTYSLSFKSTTGSPELEKILVIFTKKEFLHEEIEGFNSFVFKNDTKEFTTAIQLEKKIGNVSLFEYDNITINSDAWNQFVSVKNWKYVTILGIPTNRATDNVYLHLSLEANGDSQNKTEGLLRIKSIGSVLEIPFNIFFSLEKE